MLAKLRRVVRVLLVALFAALGTLYVLAYPAPYTAARAIETAPDSLFWFVGVVIVGGALALVISVSIEVVQSCRQRRVTCGLVAWTPPTVGLLYIATLLLISQSSSRGEPPRIFVYPVTLLDDLAMRLFSPLYDAFWLREAGDGAPDWFPVVLSVCLLCLTLLLIGCVAALALWLERRRSCEDETHRT